MREYYDRYETRAPRSREATLLRDLRGILSVGKARAATLRMQLKGVEIDAVRTRADLAQIPVLRRSELALRQKETPPFGGACATRPGALQHLLMARDGMFQPQGNAKDWWNSARALFAAGIRKGDIVLNCFSYHLAAEGHIIDCGSRALGCPIIPAGHDDLDAARAVIDHYRPVAYCGSADYLKTLIDASVAGEAPMATIKSAFVDTTSCTDALQAEFATHGIVSYTAYATADLGVVAYESEARDALIVNEGLIVEIVRPGTNEPLPAGQIGEIVVTRLNADYPLLRFGTGDLSCIVAGQSPCGRTNMRIRSPLGSVDESVEIAGTIIAPGHLREIAAQHAELGRLRLVVRAPDQLILEAEAAADSEALREKLTETLFAVTKVQGAAEIVPQGSLPDGHTISDERPKQD